MLELEVSNFQSIKHAKVVVDRFTAIEGRSNIGKSAFIRAIQCALTGAVGTDFVRHGPDCERILRGNKKCKCSSKVLFRSPKLTFTWEKGDSVNRYKVLRQGSDTPEIYDGLERGTPEFLLPDFKMVQIGQKKELIQVPAQFEPVFLLNQSGPAVADVLSDVARLDCINKATGLVTKDRKDIASRRKVREEDIISLNSSLNQYVGLDEIPVKEVEDTLADLKKAKKDLAQVDGFIRRLQGLKLTLQGLLTALKPDLPDMCSLTTPYEGWVQIEEFQARAVSGRTVLLSLSEALKPELPETTTLLESSQGLVQVNSFLTKLHDRIQATSSLGGVDQVELPDVLKVTNSCDALQCANQFSQRLSALTKTIAHYTGLDKVSIPDISNLAQLWPQIAKVSDYLRDLTVLQDSLTRGSSLQIGSDLDVGDLSDKFSTFSQADSLHKNFSTLADAVRSTKHSLDEMANEVEEAVQELEALGTCPTCSQSFSKGQHLHLEGL